MVEKGQASGVLLELLCSLLDCQAHLHVLGQMQDCSAALEVDCDLQQTSIDLLRHLVPNRDTTALRRLLLVLSSPPETTPPFSLAFIR